jgi:hypothetical protein
MQRNGNDGIGVLEHVGGCPSQEAGERAAERNMPFVFQGRDSALERTLVRPRTEHRERLM